MTPGATTSGFSRSEIGVGPAEENPAIDGEAPDVAAPTVIAVRGASRGAERPASEVVEVVPGGHHGHDARGGRRVERERDEVARRLDLGLAEREVDHVHAVGDGGLDRRDDLGRVAVEPEARLRRDRQRLVVADVRARGDAADAQPVRERVRVPGGDPGDVRRVPRLARGRTACRRTSTSRRAAGTRGPRSPSRVVYAVWPFGKPSGIVYPVGSKNGCRWSTPSSMIPILIPAPAFASVRRGKLSCPDRRRVGAGEHG